MTDRGRQVRATIAGAAIAAGFVLGGAQAGAAVTIGQTAPSAEFCQPSIDRLQPTVSSGNGYVVPPTVAAGTITSWSTQASAGAGRLLTMKVYRPLGGNTFLLVGRNGPHALSPSSLNTFAASIPVRAGDVLGSSTPAAANLPGCSFGAPGDQYRHRPGDLADGASGLFPNVTDDVRLNVSAVVAPLNSFKVVRVRRNKRKGTATLLVKVPNPGKLGFARRGGSKSAGGRALAAKKVSAPGKVKLTVRARAKKLGALNTTGRVTVRAKLAYTPTGGATRTRVAKVKLSKRI